MSFNYDVTARRSDLSLLYVNLMHLGELIRRKKERDMEYRFKFDFIPLYNSPKYTLQVEVETLLFLLSNLYNSSSSGQYLVENLRSKALFSSYD